MAARYAARGRPDGRNPYGAPEEEITQQQEEAMQMAADMQAMHLNNVNKMQKALRQQHAHAQSKLAHAADQQARVQESLECTADELARSKQGRWRRLLPGAVRHAPPAPASPAQSYPGGG